MIIAWKKKKKKKFLEEMGELKLDEMLNVGAVLSANWGNPVRAAQLWHNNVVTLCRTAYTLHPESQRTNPIKVVDTEWKIVKRVPTTPQ